MTESLGCLLKPEVLHLNEDHVSAWPGGLSRVAVTLVGGSSCLVCRKSAAGIVFANVADYRKALASIEMHIQLDALGGIAGDMFIAAMLDAWPEMTDGLLRAVRAAGVPDRFAVSLCEGRDHVFRGRRFLVVEREHDQEHGHGHGHEHDHSHDQQPFRDIAVRLRSAPLEPGVAGRAVSIFELLARAEADVHGVAVEDVVFHEVGAWDSIADIVGAAFLIESLGPTSWALSPLPLGGGRVATAHGPMPVPAPATAILLRGFELLDDGVEGERVTPTGAAILAYLRAILGPPSCPAGHRMTLRRTGTGFGTRRLPGISNVLRVMEFETADEVREDDRVGVIHFEIDDQPAEDLAVALDVLRARDDVLDIVQMPAFGKKGRMVAHVQILCLRQALDQVIEACFMQTTTIGLRWSVTTRATLARELAAVETGDGAVTVKRVTLPDGSRRLKAEVEDARAAGGHADRARVRREARRLASPGAEEGA
jgi:pyridinium-3,5-bisthiocarboxylic acid mononucleotide nickel chelatase